MLTIKSTSGQLIDIATLKEGKLLCIVDEADYNFYDGRTYHIHYDNADEGPYIFGTTGFFGSSDQTNLKQLPQNILDKFILQ